MTKLENVLYALNCRAIDAPSTCTECPYYNAKWCCCNTKYIMKDALDLLRGQEPQVMTLEDVYVDPDRVVWIEYDTSKTLDIGQYRGHAGMWERFVTINLVNEYLYKKSDEYGKTWRCWTSRPTPKQMRGTPWEEDSDAE